MTQWTATVVELEDGELGLEFTPEMLSEIGWNKGDTLIWTDLKNGTWSLSKSDNH